MLMEVKYFLSTPTQSLMYETGDSLLDSPVSISMCFSPVDAMIPASLSTSCRVSFFLSMLLCT